MNTELNFWNDSGIRSPWRNLLELQRGMDRLFDDAWGEAPRRAKALFQPSCDVEETDSHYLLSIDVPGISRNDIAIEFRDNQLIVSGHRKRDEKSSETTRLSTERRYGQFERVFTLPVRINAERIEAEYKEGVLMVAVPKEESARPKRIPIREGKDSFLGKIVGKKNNDGVAA